MNNDKWVSGTYMYGHTYAHNMYKYRVIQKLCNLNKHATIKLIIGMSF